MATVIGVHVPELGDNPLGEICHSFVYRYLVAKGNIKGQKIKDHDPMRNLMTVDAEFLYNANGEGLPARVGGIMQPTMGSIIVFKDTGNRLQHSMIAIDNDTWIGANNTTCFGVAGGRQTIAGVGAILRTQTPAKFGWVNDGGNRWDLGSIGILTVNYIDPPVCH